MPYGDDFTEFMPTDHDEWWGENKHLHDPETGLALDQFPPMPSEQMIPDPGFPEEEVDTHFDPDHGREDRHPPHEWSPEENDWEHQREHEDHRTGAILRQAEQWPARAGAKPDAPGHANIDHQFYNRDPEQGTTVPHMMGGDPEGIVSVEPPGDHGGARVMYPDETGLEYPVIARPSEHGGYDVLHPLG